MHCPSGLSEYVTGSFAPGKLTSCFYGIDVTADKDVNLCRQRAKEPAEVGPPSRKSHRHIDVEGRDVKARFRKEGSDEFLHSTRVRGMFE